MTQHDPNELFEALPPGTLLGRYQIVRVLGYGGMGAVYEGIHRDLKKRVAIKTLHPSVAALPAARARFLREGEAASRINHPNVVDVTDVGTENGITYLVMEFLEGEDLAIMLHRVGALPFPAAVDIMLAVVAAIAVAHDEGVVHRDLKPGNIFMAHTRHGGTKPTVLDFGISKLSAGSGSTLALTGTGAAMGTPYYVAPEQIRSAAGADARSDQYALGAILYECVSGQRAHQGESVYDVIRSVGEGSFPSPRAFRPDIPQELEDAILRAMRLDPSGRFASARAFGRAIIPFASPAGREHWASALSTGAEGGGTSSTTLVAHTPAPGPAALPFSTPAPKAGGTVVMPTPDPVAPAKLRTPVSRSRPRSVPDTTFGASAAQMKEPRRGRPGLVVGGFALLAGGAIATYFVLAPPSRDHRRPPLAATAPATTEPAPARTVRVKVVATPKTARISIDGRLAGTGSIDEELPADGDGHTLAVTADGFEPARFRFRDSPPPGEVTLERLAADPVSAKEETKDETPATDPAGKARGGVATRPPRATSRGHARTAAGNQHRAGPPPAGPAPAVRGANNAAIIE